MKVSIPFRKYISSRLKRKKKTLQFVQKLRARVPLWKTVERLGSEIRLLTQYSSDTVYRLKYDSMSYDYVSPAVMRLLGYTPEEMRRINFRSLIHETKIVNDGIRKIDSFTGLEEARRRGDVSKWQADYLIRTKDGRKIWVTDISYPWFNDEGKIIGSIGTLRDITDRVRAEEKMQQELVRMAQYDQLTSLANRRTFFDKLEEELKRLKRSRSEFSILLIDVDHLKRINDNHGHDIGDKVLVELGEVIHSCLRDADMVARVGGEEFGVFLPDTPESSAYWVAERICSVIAKHSFYAKDGKTPINCTVSIGVASATMHDTLSSTDLYKLADTRLYIAKNTGRNQVSVDEVVRLH